MIYHKVIVEDVKLLATLRSVRRYMKYGCKYSLYCDCKNCKNRSFYDESYCNNEILHFIGSGKTTRVYCERFKV